MVTPILRIDISENSRDFQLVALEPGLPMLDRYNVNSSTLFKWLGPLVAEPEFDGDAVRFYARDVMGGRPEGVECHPATDKDLQGPLKKDFAALQEKIKKISPENSTEEAICRILRASVKVLASDSGEVDREIALFKYRIGNEPWRLVWCWGYQRRDHQPAPTMICNDPACRLLFLRRPGQKAVCPGCSESSTTLVSRRSRKVPALAALVLLLLIALGLLWWLNRPKLIVTPEMWAGRAGSSVEFQVQRKTLFGSDDVSGRVVAVSANPGVIEFDQHGTRALAKAKGEALVRFYLDGLSSEVAVTITPPENPRRIWIEPEGTIELGVDSTARPKVMGEWSDGATADLTDSIAWESRPDGVVRVYHGVVEGLAEGEETLTARYRASTDNDWVETTALVRVTPKKYDSLELTLDPAELVVGQMGRIELKATAGQGDPDRLTDSTKVTYSIQPEGAASVKDGYVTALKEGPATLLAVYDHPDGKLDTKLEFSIGTGALVQDLIVLPEKLELLVGEVGELSYKTPDGAAPEFATSDPAVVEIVTSEPSSQPGRQKVVARAAGSATITVKHGDRELSVPVAVSADDVLAQCKEVVLEPALIAVPVGQFEPFAAFGIKQDGSRVELSPKLVVVERKPSANYATVDEGLMTVTGVSPTGANDQQLSIRAGHFRTGAKVRVIGAGTGIASLLVDPWRQHGPVDLLVPEVVRIAGHDVRVRARPDGGVVIVEGLDDQLPLGFHVGDYIDRIGARRIRSIADLRDSLVTIDRGGVDAVTVLRGGDSLDLRVISGGNVFEQVGVTGPFKGSDPEHFTVKVDVVAARDKGQLQYRAYVDGSDPPEQWNDAVANGSGVLAAQFNSSDVKQRALGERYPLVIESRAGEGGEIQKHVYSFVMESQIRRDEPK